MSNKTTSVEEVGYDVKVIGDYPSKLNCTICSLIMKKSMYGCRFKHSFCQSCITKHIQCVVRNEGTVTCPGGCGEIIIPTDLQPNQFADLMIYTLKTKCLNEYCSWQGDLLDLVQVHQINCDYKKLACDINGCDKMFLKKDVELHKSNCLYNIIQCSYCHNDILRINEEKHELECELKEVKCEFHAIGCKVLFHRKDRHSHGVSYQTQHMWFIYENSKSKFSDCYNEITKVREDLLKSITEVETLKQENAEFKIELIELKNKSDIKFNKKLIKEDVIRKRQNISPASKFKVHKALNFIFLVLLHLTINETKSQSKEINSTTNEIKSPANKINSTTNEINSPTNEINSPTNEINSPTNEINSPINETKLKMELKAARINNLKSKIREVPEILDKITLINNDNVVVVQVSYNSQIISVESKNQCYEHRQCNGVIDQLGFTNHKILLNELLLEIPNHLYEDGNTYYHFYFPFDLDNVKDFHVSIPDKFNMKIINNKVLVETTKVEIIILFVRKYGKHLQNGVTFNLKQLDDSMLSPLELISYGNLVIGL